MQRKRGDPPDLGWPLEGGLHVDIVGSYSSYLRPMFHISDLAGLVLKIVDLAGIAFRDHLLPSSRKPLTKVMQEHFVSYRSFYRALLCGSPSGRDGTRSMDVRVQVERHLEAGISRRQGFRRTGMRG